MFFQSPSLIHVQEWALLDGYVHMTERVDFGWVNLLLD